MASRPKRATICTLGCRLNQAESSLIAERLQQAGYVLADAHEPVDLCIVNTCTVTNEADAKSRKAIRALIRKHPGAFVAVIGCYAQLAHKALAGIKGVDLIVGNREKLNVLDYVSDERNDAPRIVCGDLAPDDFSIDAAGASLLTCRANLKIQDGCDFHCSYCIVSTARGPSRNRRFDNLLEEARRLVEHGVKEIVLTGVNVGTYCDAGRSLVDVVDALDAMDGLRRIRVGSVELNMLDDGLLERMKDAGHALVPFLHIPLQSGSNRVLARMGRCYMAEDAMAFLRKADETVPDVCIGTDLLVGMPGENEEDFETTCRFLEQSPIAYAHVFKYSDRKGAPAAEMDGKVEPKTLDRRAAHVRRIAEAKRRDYHGRYVGKEASVLFEEFDGRYWRGYTGNYLRVAVCCNDDMENTIRTVVIETDCGEYLRGRLTRLADTLALPKCLNREGERTREPSKGEEQ